MRVKIEHQELKVGWPFPKACHEVHLTVDFTEEELQIIHQRELTEHHLFDRIPFGARVDDDPDWYILKVRHLLTRKPDKFRLKTPSEARRYAEQLAATMAEMKAWLEDNIETGRTTLYEF